MKKIKIAYFDLGLSKEDFSLNSKRYGVAGVIPRYLKQEGDIDFYCFAPAWCYENFSYNDKKDKCITLSLDICKAIETGYPLDKIIDGLQFFDIILFFHGNLFLNRGELKTPLVHIAGFDGDCGHPNNDYILFYDTSFYPKFGEKAKYFTLGKPVPNEFKEYKKEDFVFQCSRIDWTMRPNFAIEECAKHGIDIFLAGPIQNNYPLFINHPKVHYLGEIDEETKDEYYKRARLFTLLHDWNKLPFNQSVIEANGYGTPILATKIGPFFNKYLRDGINGFAYNSYNFIECWEKAKNINQKDCWEAAREYRIENVMKTLKQCFVEILEETENV